MAMGVLGNMSRYECLSMSSSSVLPPPPLAANSQSRSVISSPPPTKKVMDSLHAAWRALSSTEQNHNNHVALVTDYKSKIESELSHSCNRVLNLLEKHLIPSAYDNESKVFYLKMKGDYYRYITEFKVGTERTEASENTIMAYKAAEAIAVSELAPTLPTRLGLALNFSVFFYKIEGASEKARSMAREAYEEDMAKLDSLGNKKHEQIRVLLYGQTCPANRYKDTVNFMEKVIIGSTSSSSGSELTIEERNLLSTATKKVMDLLYAAWRALSSTEQNHNNHVALVTDYKSKIESELSYICNRVLNLLEKHLIPSVYDSESKVFYLKMKGDYLLEMVIKFWVKLVTLKIVQHYYRCMTEFKVGTERTEAFANTIMAYKAAEAIAVFELTPTLPTRLGLALNFSVFCYEIKGASEKARSMAREAYEEDMAKLDSLGNKSYKETSLLILQLMRDNLNLWAFDMEITIYSCWSGLGFVLRN
ncbi:unnamed protein product [Camellia sinensis]